MKYLGRTDGNSRSTDWLLTVPDLLDSDGIKVSGPGPKHFNQIFEEHGLQGPALRSWTKLVSISRGGADLGTVKNFKMEVIEARYAKMNSKTTQAQVESQG